jgi:hypothetical protein
MVIYMDQDQDQENAVFWTEIQKGPSKLSSFRNVKKKKSSLFYFKKATILC